MTEGDFEHGGNGLRRVHFQANSRKKDIYWTGFLEGALSSDRIERSELQPLLAEAQNFAEFFDDHDARDLAEDLEHVHASQADVFRQISDIVAYYRERLAAEKGDPDKDEINEFLGFCAGVICDGKVLQKEAEALLARMDRAQKLLETPYIAKMYRIVSEALADDHLDEEEAADIAEWIARLVGDGYADTGLPSLGISFQPETMIHDHEVVTFTERVFVLTGALRSGPRKEIHLAIEQCGGKPASSVSKKVDYIVIALTASRDWAHTSYGRKIERAHEIIEEGGSLMFVSERAFELALERHLRP